MPSFVADDKSKILFFYLIYYTIRACIDANDIALTLVCWLRWQSLGAMIKCTGVVNTLHVWRIVVVNHCDVGFKINNLCAEWRP